MVFRNNGKFIIALTYGPGSQWVRNVLAADGCDFETHGQTLSLSKPRLFHDTQRRDMPAVVRIALAILNVSDFMELTLSGHAASH
jgi:hypothetical protein